MRPYREDAKRVTVRVTKEWFPADAGAIVHGTRQLLALLPMAKALQGKWLP